MDAAVAQQHGSNPQRVCGVCCNALLGRSAAFTMPVFCKQRPALVIAPSAADFQVPTGIAFASKSQSSDQGDRGAIHRLNVCFDAMEPQPIERQAQDSDQCLAHVSLPRERLPDLVAEVRTAKLAGDDFTEFDCAEDCVVSAPQYEPALVSRIAVPSQKVAKGGGRSGRRR
jgi:hypothetical protein